MASPGGKYITDEEIAQQVFLYFFLQRFHALLRNAWTADTNRENQAGMRQIGVTKGQELMTSALSRKWRALKPDFPQSPNSQKAPQR
jgi:hypothetical protein